MSRSYYFRSTNPGAVRAAVEEALNQVRAYPDTVAKEAGLPPKDVREAIAALETSYKIEKASSSGITGAELQTLLVVLPSTVEIVDSIWDHFILPWLKSKRLEAKRKDPE